MGKFVGRTAATVVLTAGVALATTGAAYGAGPVSSVPGTNDNSSNSPPTLSAIKSRATDAISIRLTALNKADSAVRTRKFISSGDKATLLGTLNGDASGLTSLGQKIEGDTTVTQARSDYQTIFLGYRVFALAVPQVRFASLCDRITGAVLPRLSRAQSKLQRLLSGQDSSADTPTVQSAMSDLASQMSAIASATSGLSAGVLALTPAQYDADHAILSSAKSTLVAAAADVQKARQDVATVTAALK